jgi:hypothetical protein
MNIASMTLIAPPTAPTTAPGPPRWDSIAMISWRGMAIPRDCFEWTVREGLEGARVDPHRPGGSP